MFARLGLAGTLSAIAFVGASASAFATGVSCGENDANCSFKLFVDGSDTPIGTGHYDLEDGKISLSKPAVFTLPDDSTFTVNNISGSSDPFVLISASATTFTSGHTYTATFDVPINISGNVTADSSISYSLTAGPNQDSFVKTTDPLHKILRGADIQTTGSLSPLDKKVDTGDNFEVNNTGGAIPKTGNSPIFTAHNPLLFVDKGYDLMQAQVQFSLSPNSSVGMSGSLSQIASVPEPSSSALITAGLLLLGVVSYRRLKG